MAAADTRNAPRPRRAPPPGREAGYSMIEVLVSLIVLLLGLLGLLGLQARAQTAELESYQRAQALVLLQDIADRMNANRGDAWNLVYRNASVGGGGALADCADTSGAARDLCEWGNLLKGAAEVTGGGACSAANGAACAGAMIGARGCITYDSTTELANSGGAVIAGTGVYTISVVWQGLVPTVAPASTLACGSGGYNGEGRRRVVTSTVRIAALGAS